MRKPMFSEIVANYIREHRGRATAEFAYFSGLADEVDAISVAALGEYPKGKRHAHQRRVTAEALKESQQRLVDSEPALRAVISFNELIKLVGTVIRPIHGIGE